MSAITELSKLRRGGGRPVDPRERKAARRDNKAALVFLLPWLLGLVVITAGPMVASFYLSFTDYNLLEDPNWVGGVENYLRMLSDERLHQSLKVTLTYVVVGVPLQLAVALFIAVALNRGGMRGLSFYRSVFYLPSLLGGSVAIAILWRQIFGTTGLVNQVLGLFGIEGGMGWISSPDTALGTIILLHVWTFGSPMIIFLAGLRQIPTMYYEAAAVDGGPPRPSSSGASRCRCSPRSSSSTSCCRRSGGRSSRSRRRSSSRAGSAARPTRRSSTRCTSTTRGVQGLRDGLRLRDGVVARPHRGRPHRRQLHRLEVLGPLR